MLHPLCQLGLGPDLLSFFSAAHQTAGAGKGENLPICQPSTAAGTNCLPGSGTPADLSQKGNKRTEGKTAD
jgi:hypothetical protein